MGCYNVCSFSYNLKTHYALCMVIMQKECCWNLLHFIFLSSWKLQINYSTEFNQTAYINYGFGSQLTEKDYLRLALLMICPWFVDIEYWYKNDPYIIIYKISQLVYFKYSILTNHGHIISFTRLLIMFSKISCLMTSFKILKIKIK